MCVTCVCVCVCVGVMPWVPCWDPSGALIYKNDEGLNQFLVYVSGSVVILRKCKF